MDQKSLSCPLCLQEGRVNNLMFVNYKRDEAFFTCESRNCTYFEMDTQGSPVKYKYDLDLKRFVPMTCVEQKNLLVEPDKRLPSVQEMNTAPQDIAESISSRNLILTSDALNDTSDVHGTFDSVYDSNDLTFLDDFIL